MISNIFSLAKCPIFLCIKSLTSLVHLYRNIVIVWRTKTLFDQPVPEENINHTFLSKKLDRNRKLQ